MDGPLGCEALLGSVKKIIWKNSGLVGCNLHLEVCSFEYWPIRKLYSKIWNNFDMVTWRK